LVADRRWADPIEYPEMVEPIPFNRPCLVGNELERINEAILNGHSATGGPFAKRCAAMLQEFHGAADVLMTTSCTDALEMSAMLIGVGPGDTVVVPSFTFTSTALAFAREGAGLKFADIDPLTLGLDPESVASVMDETVRAIVVVHYAGVPADIDGLSAIAERWGVPLVEDNAHGLFVEREGRPLGTFGRISTVSFHETKNFICGEGGALILNDPADVDKARVLYDKGTNRQAFLNGLVDKYTWQGLGSSFGMSDLLAAFLWAQLESAEEVQRKRRAVSETYRAVLAGQLEPLGVQIQREDPRATPADHMFHVILPHEVDRSSVIAAMRLEGIHPTFHYVPLHSAPAGLELGVGRFECPVTDDLSARLLRLPFFSDLEGAEIERVCDVFLRSLQAAGA
jgi:dTDP-4-amino-4,6-dideoxygalactose transaminase